MTTTITATGNAIQDGFSFVGTHGAITSGTPTLVDATADSFFSDTVNYHIRVAGAGAGSADLITTISSVAGGVNSTCTLAANAGTTVTAAAWTLGTSTPSGNATTTTGLLVVDSVAVGDILIACLTTTNTGDSPAASNPLTDNAGNAWTLAGSKLHTGVGTIYTYYSIAKFASAANTLVITATLSAPALGGFRLTTAHFGVIDGTARFDQYVASNGSGTSVSTGNLTTAVANSVVFAQTTVDNAVTAAAQGGWTVQAINNGSGSPQDIFGDVWKFIINTGTGTFDATATQSAGGAANWAMSEVSFVVSGSAASLRTQERVPGFPPNAPLPGVPQLGRGVWLAPAPPAAKAPLDPIFFSTNH